MKGVEVQAVCILNEDLALGNSENLNSNFYTETAKMFADENLTL